MILESSPDRERQFLLLGAVSGFLAVAFGAFGAHALRDILGPDELAAFETGVRWHVVHAVALVVAGLVCGRRFGRWAPAAGWLFAAGTVLFSGSLYLLAVTGARAWGAVTPVGGVAWLAGWAALAISGLKRRLVVVEIEEDARIITVQAGGDRAEQPAETEH